MKKALSVVLAIVLAFSAFAFTAFAEEATVSKTEALVNSVLANKEFSADIVLGDSINSQFGDLQLSDITVYAKNNKLAAKCKVFGFLSAKIIIADNSAVLYLTALPFISFNLGDLGIDISADNLWNTVKDYLDFDAAKLTTSTDAEYYIEKFDFSYSDYAGFTADFVFSGDSIKSVELIDNGETVISVENISFTVDDSVFKAPGGFDLMAILEKIFAVFG